MTTNEYLLSYGRLGDFGRFYPVTPLACRRGQRAVVRSPRGVELASVLGDARPGHAAFLPNTTVGQILRLATSDDEAAARRRLAESEPLLEEARRRAGTLGLPVEVVDVEYLLDGEHAVFHFVRWADFDPRPLVSALSRQFALHIGLHDLSGGAVADDGDEEEHGCGREGCGEGGCGTEGGGCSTCGVSKVDDIKAYFAARRGEMEARHGIPSV